jgi:hypothetical protein
VIVALSSPTSAVDEAPPDRGPLEALRAILAPFNTFDLAAVAGALELIPQNAERTVRLQAFAHTVASLPYKEESPRISASRLRATLNGRELGALAYSEDPFPNAFVEEVAYYGGSYAVFPGAMSGATFTFRHLANSIFQQDDFPRYIAGEIHPLILGTLRLSNAMARGAGLRRGADPSPNASSSIVVPDSQRLSALKAAVTFSREQMEAFFGKGDIGNMPWSRLTCTPRSLNNIDFSFEDSLLLLTPIIQFGNAFVICCPEALIACLNHHIVAMATQNGARDVLVDHYANAVTNSVETSMRYMDIRPSQVRIPGSPIAGSRELVFRCDSDKAIYATVVPDQLRDFLSELASGGDENPGDLASQLSRRIKEVEEHLYRKPGLNGLLCLFVHAGVGRGLILGLDSLTIAATFQVFPANELETFALLNGGNSLGLWRFAREANRLRDEGVEVISWSPLDEFGVYRSRRSSFYLSDREVPNVLTVGAEFSGSLRRETVNVRDWHAVPHYEGDAVIEVTTLHSKKEIPIYIPSEILTDRVAVFVEGLPIPVWILAPEKEDRSSDHRMLYSEFASALAYWLWQCSDWLKLNFVHNQARRPLLVNLVLEEPSGWSELPAPIREDGRGDAVSAATNAQRSEVDIRLGHGVSAIFNRADNYGERECLKKLLRGVCDVLGGERRISSGDIDALVNEVAPLGMKKMLLLLNIDHLPQLDPRNIPHYRGMQEGEVDDVLASLGTYLRTERSLPVGPIAKDRRNEVIKDAVDFCYRRLQNLVSSHSQSGFLEFLVAEHEAVAREDAYRKLTIPTRIACFASVGDVVRQLQEELPEIARAALASRFLIEYAVAQPPSGLRPISLGSYDEMRALADHIITFGRTSDALKYDLDDIELAILESGRLGRRGLSFHEASNSHMRQVYTEQIAKSPDEFTRNWRTVEPAREPNRAVADLDRASSKEFGFTMSEISEFFGAVQVIGYEVGPGFSVLPRNELVERVSRQLGWNQPRVTEAIALFALGPRKDFLATPRGFSNTDVYPWRFNRALSYVRRPLLLRGSAEVEVLWGNRHMEAARENLLMLCFSGRLKAKSGEMGQFLGKQRHRAGQDFNHATADVVRAHVGKYVKERVKKVGHLRPVGDIDVLALDRKKKQINVIECKDLSIARTPHELATEVKELLYSTEKKRSDIAKHQDMVKWAKEHILDLLKLFDIDSARGWNVNSFLVVDQPLMTGFLANCPERIVTIEQLRERIP